eukprot:636274_1
MDDNSKETKVKSAVNRSMADPLNDLKRRAEYIIILHESINDLHVRYLVKRIIETGLTVEQVCYNSVEKLNYLKVYTSKEWLIDYFTSEEHMEEYLSFDVNVNTQQQRFAQQIEDLKRLPKSAIIPPGLLAHIIHVTLHEIPIDARLIEILKSIDAKTNAPLMDMDKLLPVCQQYPLIEDTFPMSVRDDHSLGFAQNRRKKWKLFFNLTSYHSNNLHKIRDYYGEQIAFYFAFMEHYATWLMIPGVCGLLFYLTRSKTFDIDESKYMPFFALFVCIWSHLMIKFWNRRASDLSLKWNTIQFGHESYLTQSDVRPQFHGEIRQSPITNKPERYYMSYKRYPKFAVGIVITLSMLSLVFGMMVCSLNMQGYISSTQSVIYIESFASLSKPGAKFDKDSNIMWLVPTLVHCIFVFLLNGLYSKVAFKLTEWENWKFESQFENSFILKRFLFEFLDAFLPLFYICFYEMDMDVLTGELLSLFLCDEIRRVFTESVLPLVSHLWELMEMKKRGNDDKDETSNVVWESRLEKYELFDDYLEMITQFGYITLFASCYPLAAVLSLISNVLEVWSDSFKLVFLSQRPVVERAYNMHSTWVKILQFMAWFSILTNCYIFAFSSEQMEEWFPQFFNPDQVQQRQNVEEIKTGHGRYVVLIMFALEHVIGLVCLLIHYMIHDVPSNVDIQLQKKQHALHLEYIENMSKKRKLLHQNKDTNASKSSK